MAYGYRVFAVDGTGWKSPAYIRWSRANDLARNMGEIFPGVRYVVRRVTVH